MSKVYILRFEDVEVYGSAMRAAFAIINNYDVREVYLAQYVPPMAGEDCGSWISHDWSCPEVATVKDVRALAAMLRKADHGSSELSHLDTLHIECAEPK